MNTKFSKNETSMLPSIEAFLCIWDDPNDFTHLEFATQGRECQIAIVVETPDCPALTFELPILILGRA